MKENMFTGLLMAGILAASECCGADNVNAADFGYNATNATAALQAAIDSGKLPEVMQTVPGARIAVERAKFMSEFFSRLDEETRL